MKPFLIYPLLLKTQRKKLLQCLKQIKDVLGGSGISRRIILKKMNPGKQLIFLYIFAGAGPNPQPAIFFLKNVLNAIGSDI